MRKLIAAMAATAFALAVSSAGGPAAWSARPAAVDAPATLGASRVATPAAIGSQPVITGAAFPAAFTFFADGRILYGERFTGDIRIHDPSNGQDTLFFTVTKLALDGEQGLLGLAIHPRFPAKPFVYAYATRLIGGQPRDQILRITYSGGVGTSMSIIFSSDTVSGSYHDGGRIMFGPDGKLYAVVGEAHSPANAQNLSNNAGKVLRMTGGGGVPAGNPFPGSVIFAYGLRNSYGFTFDPQTGLLWETENGPQCNDEINIERSGENHAWGSHWTCSGQDPQNTNQDGPVPRIMPLRWFSPTIAPVGAAFCSGCGLSGAEGTMLFGTYNTANIREVTLTADRQGIASIVVAYSHSDSILSMERGPDGTLYFSDSTSIRRLIQT